MHIRLATDEDAEYVVEFLWDFRAENIKTVLLHETVPSVHEEAKFINRLRDESGAMFLAIDEDTVIGCLTVETQRHLQLRHSCEFGIGVLHSRRSSGIGSALIENLLEWSRNGRIRRVELNVFANNIDAIRLYQRLGFREEGRKLGAVYVEPDYIDVVQMVLIH